MIGLVAHDYDAVIVSICEANKVWLICGCLKVCKHFMIKCCSNIRVVPVGMSKAVKKLVRGQVPNLANYNDISDFVLR